ncbi:hypothetical protein AB0L75_35405 [Streptomyces sp. NPDC052101]|uniref:hypothetical protein n=1 Tax=Streptomyces sp. NPDC052101 TaxID=3155763 RepID=UPI003412BC72
MIYNPLHRPKGAPVPGAAHGKPGPFGPFGRHVADENEDVPPQWHTSVSAPRDEER